MGRAVRNKRSGQFQGSVGTGKTKVPQPGAQKPAATPAPAIAEEPPHRPRSRTATRDPRTGRRTEASPAASRKFIDELLRVPRPGVLPWSALNELSDVLRSPRTPQHLLNQVAVAFRFEKIQAPNGPREMMALIVAHKNCPQGWMDWAAASQDYYIRLSLARNPALTESGCAHLINDAPKPVHFVLACNQHLPPEWLAGLVPTADERTLQKLAPRLVGAPQKACLDRIAAIRQEEAGPIAAITSGATPATSLTPTGPARKSNPRSPSGR